MENKPMEFDIDKDIPLPSPRSSGTSYGFGNMEVGDSFVAPIVYRPRIASALFSWGQKHPPFRGSVRKIDKVSIRVWRIE